MSDPDPFDLLIIGGGINGAGIARDAAGRGMRVCLVEQGDLASATSGASTKLVHGGLRYLEHYAFRLVRESLIERERLLAIAPHIVWPLRFVLPHHSGLRPRWLLRAGLWLYDHIGGRRQLPATREVDLGAPPHDAILKPSLTHGFEYSDCWVEDSRLVVLNCLDAAERGAAIRVATRCEALTRGAQHWTASLRTADGTETLHAKAVVNAAGPWVDQVLGQALPGREHANLRLVKGSHLIFARLYEGEHAYIFQNGDGRIVFAIPYERDFTLVGTTDVAFAGDLSKVAISDAEAEYICAAASDYLRVEIRPEQAVASYAGVRPLFENRAASDQAVTRDYVLELDRDGPALLSIFGGKITTYRKLAEHALARLNAPGRDWTGTAPLPGGDIPVGGFEDFVAARQAALPWLAPETVRRLARAYGTRMTAIIGDATRESDLGKHFGGGLYEAELDYLVRCEFARNADDVLMRRSKLALHLAEEEQARIARWFDERL